MTIAESFSNANELNNFFADASAGSAHSNQIVDFFGSNLKIAENRFELREVTTDEVKKATISIKSKAEGCDNINIKLIHLVVPYCLNILTHIINFSISEKVIPTIWKKSINIPLPKKNPPAALKDLRAIHILPAFSKILEIVVHNQVIPYADSHIFTRCQSGYRKSMGTHTTLLKISNDITTNVDHKKATFLVLLDFSKAFDCIHHDIVIAKLKYYGFSANTLEWFQNYLQGRTQWVKWYENLSDEIEISQGVPQGSILGPFSFSVSVTDLPDCAIDLVGCSIDQYVDDTQIVCAVTPELVPASVQLINYALERISSWSRNKGLVLIASKSVAMCCGSSNLRDRTMQKVPEIMLDNEVLPFEPSVENLGLIFDSHLNFEEHVTKLLSNAYAKFKYIYQFKVLLSCDVKWKLCNALILSTFNYCSSTYYPFSTKEFKNRIQRLQNCCFRYSFLVPFRDHITPYYNEREILKTTSVFLIQYLCLIFKLLKSKQPSYLYRLLHKRSDVHNSNLRSSHLYDIPKHNSVKYEHCFSYLAVKLINKYSEFFTTCNTVATLKIHLKEHFLREQENGTVEW